MIAFYGKSEPAAIISGIHDELRMPPFEGA
jgi:hypothetical protein